MEQVSFSVRHVDLEKLELREDFLQFIPTTDTTGKKISKFNLKKS